MFYSAETAGFYDPVIHSEIPADAVEITTDEHEVLLAGQAAGKRIVPDENGYPILVDPPAPTLTDAKATQHAAIATAFSLAAQNLTAGYPEAERLTWPTQQSEALAWEADNSTPTPYLDSIAAARGIDVQQMRNLTVTQVHAFQTASAQLVGTRQKLRDQIDAVTDATPDAVGVVRAIVWPA